MYFKSRLIFTCIVWCSLPECGNTSNVFTVSHGTFTTFPLIFFCPPRGAANTFINGILGETSLHSTWCKSLRCCGISGKPIPFAVELGGNFFSFKWLKHVLQINSFPSHWRISGRHTSAAWQSGTLFLCTTTTLCLYHSWSHTQHLWTGPFPTSLWKFFIKSSMDSCLLRDIFFRAVSRICSRFLFTESFLAICFLSLLHSRSLSLYATSFLALCMLFLLDSRSLSLYAGSFLLGLVRCLSYSLNSDCVLACLFHSVLYCRLLSLSIWAERLSHVSLAAFSTLSLASALFFSYIFEPNLSETVSIYRQLPELNPPFQRWNRQLSYFYSIIRHYSTFSISHHKYFSLYSPLLCSNRYLHCLPLLSARSSHLFYELYPASAAVGHFFSSLSAWSVNASNTILTHPAIC